MNSILDRYIDGKFEYETGSLDFSCPKIELTVHRNEEVNEQFQIHCLGAERAEGYILTSHIRLQCNQKTFSGQDMNIRYSFNSKGMEEGEVLRAEFHIISNMGEYYIPFAAIVEHEKFQSSMGNIKNLFHFANLAKTNWDEAVKLFYKKDFADIFNGSDKQYFNIYQGLSGLYGNEQNVDEFLIKINKKKRTEYIPMESLIRIDAPAGIIQGKATITRNGWGYTKLSIETEGSFLSVEKDTLTDDDFLGNICSFSYTIDGTMLHAGKNWGKIIVRNASFSTTIQILVNGEQIKTIQLTNKRQMQEYLLELISLYCKLRIRKVTAANWLKNSIQIVDKMLELDERNISASLFKAQLLITEERYNEAEWQLGMIEKEISLGKENPEIWCYYLYLTTLNNRDEHYVNEITEEVENVYVQNPGNWKIAWLLLFLREEYAKSPYRKWTFLEQQFIENCKSPVLYVETVILMNANPTMLTQLTEFEIQVLNYAAKNDMLTRDVLIQLRYLLVKCKDYSERLFFVLKKGYELMHDDDTLQCILQLLIKGNRVGQEYFAWYEKGVERELRITNLYEYYMMSLPENYQSKLPKMVMMYFAYHSELNYGRKALLYANALQHKNDYPEIVSSYADAIQAFVVEQIKKGHINKELAFLYKNALTPQMLQENIGEEMIPLLFMNRIQVEADYIRSVVLIYDKLKGEMVFSLSEDHTAYFPIYASEYQILLQDAKGNRFCTDIEYSIEKMMIPGRFLKELPEGITYPLEYDLYLCENMKDLVTVTEQNCSSYVRLLKSDRIIEEYRNEIELKLIQFFYDNDLMAEGDKILEIVDAAKLSAKSRSQYIPIMIGRGMLDKAFSWVSEYGIDQIDASIMVKLCSRILARTEFEQNENLVKVIYQTFRTGKYDENIIKYLVAYYEGMTKDMRDIWTAASGFQIDTHAICEKMILQMLYSGAYVGQKDEIFNEYTKNGGRLIVEMAYLTHSSYEYFVREKILEESVFHHLTKLFYRGENFHKVCKYAYLKYYSENRDKLNESILALIQQFIVECITDHVYFAFFQNYDGLIPQVQKLMDKTMIEYHTNPNAKVNIHYILQSGEEESYDYCAEELTHMYEGIFVKSFTLFFGEKLQYYITEDVNGQEQLTQSDTIHKSEIMQSSSESKFYLINDMMIAKTLQENATIDELATEYMQKNFYVKELFTFM